MTGMTRLNINGLMGDGLQDWLAGQQAMRQSAAEKATSRWVRSAVILLPVLSFLAFTPLERSDFWAVVMVCIGLGGVWGYQPISKAKAAIKSGINSAIAASYGLTYAFDVEPGGEFAAARNYGLVPDFDRSTFEDHWHGALEGHEFSLYEAHLQDRTGKSWRTVFRGPIIRMTFGRKFRSTTLLERAGKHRKWMGLGGASDHVSFEGHRLNRVDQVHPAFGETFALYSDDQVEARVLVHPSYVEHLLRLESAFDAREMRALFTGGEVIIAIEAGNLFESGGMDVNADRANAERAARQFGAMAGLALAINQNERGRVLESEPRPAGNL